MAKKTLVAGSLALEQKKPRVITIEATEKPKDIKLRVAAYARVSSASDDQLNSFVSQNKYYTTLISSKENWAMVDIYADEGITGTSVEKRDDFKRLLADCRRRKIDRVLVKSISRFARNTKECLEAIRELKSLGVSIYFEKENIDTATMSGEMMTALFASFAQAESQSISGNMRWSVKKRMESGSYLPSSMPYGYQICNRQIQINDEQAKIVRYIFSQYLTGKNMVEIADELNALNIPKRTNDPSIKWHKSSIRYMLANERYTGDSLWQKTYMTDSFPPALVKNHGERAMYFVEGTHPAIIEKRTFQAVQELMKLRCVSTTPVNDLVCFRKKVVCGCCGRILRKKRSQKQIFWACQSSELCTIRIPHSEIEEAFCRLHFKIKKHSNIILGQMLTSLQRIRNKRMLWSLDVIEINKRISELTSQNQLLTMLKQQGLVDSDIFITQANALTEQLRAAKLEKERLLDTEHDEAIASTKELIEILEDGPDYLPAFDEELFGELIDIIIVESHDQLRFRLKNGLELTETISRAVR